MNIKQATDKLLHNWPIKLLCLVVAIFLYIFHEASLIEKKNFVVPLTVIENGEVMHTGNCPSKITITVKALPNDIPEIHVLDFKAKLDLSRIAENGSYEVPIQVDVSDTIKAFDKMEIRTNPSSVNVTVEKKISKYIPLEASVSGEVGEGYQIESISLDPSTVNVIGPESIVNTIRSIYTDKVVVSNATVNFSTEVNYLEVNKMISVTDKGPYKATVTVVPKESRRQFNEIAVLPLNLNSAFQIEGNIPNISMTLSGEVPVLDSYILPKNAVHIDLSHITEPGEYEFPLITNINSALVLEELSKESIKLNIIPVPEKNNGEEE